MLRNLPKEKSRSDKASRFEERVRSRFPIRFCEKHIRFGQKRTRFYVKHIRFKQKRIRF